MSQNNQNPENIERESMEYDVVIVGAGAAGLSAAIRLKQLAEELNIEISVCVLEKGAEVGAHILSGAILDLRALNELIPDWKEKNAPINTPVSEDRFYFLSEKGALKTPNFLLPSNFHNNGNFLISLGNFTRWLAEQAESMGVDIFPGFAAAEILYNEDGSVKGVATGNMGIGRDGKQKASFEPGMELHAKYTLFAEGARGHLGRQLVSRYALDKGRDPQPFSIGFKEIWEVPKEQHKPGLVIHSAGWPLDNNTYGGSYVYHIENNQIAIGFFVGLNYENPYLSPFEEFQRFKTHPKIRVHIEGGKRISYGARVAAAGGIQSLLELSFAGGALLGGEVSFMNAAKLKGIHTAMKSGMLCAEAVATAIKNGRANDVLSDYTEAFKNSWLYEELHKGRNFKPLMNMGLRLGSLLFGIDQVVFRGKAPWTLHRKFADHEYTRPASECEPINYPRHDGKLTFDIPSSVYLANVAQDEDQPIHCTLKDENVPVNVNFKRYAGLETRYCPAGAYEFITDENGETRLQINPANCLHCKTCDIKDPTQNIVWITPEGGSGPNYPNM